MLPCAPFPTGRPRPHSLLAHPTAQAVLEPSVFAWAVQPPAPATPLLRGAPASAPAKTASAAAEIGANFSLPHRDYSFSESWAPAPLCSPSCLCARCAGDAPGAACSGCGQNSSGAACSCSSGGQGHSLGLSLVCVWVALTEATLDNGCMFALPRGANLAALWSKQSGQMPRAPHPAT